MHGMIFTGLQKYVTGRLGESGWKELLEAAGLPNKIYMPIRAYPDEEAVQIVSAAAKRTGAPANDLLEAFGEFIVDDLMSTYRTLVQKDWRALDLIENTEETIHKVVRAKSAGAEPPRLKVTRVGERELHIEYTSHRKMCSVAKGIARGVGKRYGENLEIRETSCMHRGASRCLIQVRSLG